MKRDNPVGDVATLIARVIVGGSIAAHGGQKLFGWFGGPGMKGASGMMQSLGFTPAEKYAQAASSAELASGLLIALGALGPVGPAMLVSVMTTAVGSVHLSKGYWASNGGYELNTMYSALALLLAVHDYGRLSLDEAIGLRDRIPPWLSFVAVAAGIGAGVAMLNQRMTEKPSNVVVGEVEPSPRPAESQFTPGM